jgi:hypothetical protein
MPFSSPHSVGARVETVLGQDVSVLFTLSNEDRPTLSQCISKLSEPVKDVANVFEVPNPATGFVWVWATLPEVLRFISDTLEQDYPGLISIVVCLHDLWRGRERLRGSWREQVRDL